MSVDVERIGSILREVAAEAIMPRFRRLESADIARKTGPTDLVTIADTEAERLLTLRLTAALPGSAMVGEEGCSADAAVLGRLQEEGAVWVLDPVDGTINFATGLPLFGVLLALVRNGETEAAWLYDPVRERMATAVSGEGTWVDGQRVRLDPPHGLSALHGALNLRGGEREQAARLGARADRMGSLLVLRCAAHEYLALLEGSLHFGFYPKVMPWDHAAGALALVEAGGVSRRLDGRRYRPGDPPEGAPLLVAADAESWDAAYEGLFAGD